MIVQVHTEAVSWCSQLLGSACERADIILYSDQHAVALLISLLSWIQHMFFCICQSISIGCQHFWRILFDFFFVDPAIVDHIPTQPAYFVMRLVFFQNAFNFKCLLTCFIINYFIFIFFFFYLDFLLFSC